MSDPLWTSYETLDQARDTGLRDGIKHGENTGLTQGWEMGVRHGYEIGIQIGYYMGCISMWKRFYSGGLIDFSDKIINLISHLENMIKFFPLTNITDEDLQEKAEKIHELFKVIKSNVGLSTKYYLHSESPQSMTF